MSPAGALLVACLAQGTAAGPEALALPGYRIHLIVSEDLDPDRLRGLARSGVVLWLKTRSNALRESTVENLARFSDAYVQLRPPLSEHGALQLRRAPSTGIWLSDLDLGGAGLHRVGPRRLAVQISGALTEDRAAKVKASRAAHAIWDPPTDVDLLSWSRFEQLPGRRLVKLVGAVGCAGTSARWVDATSLKPTPEPWQRPCGPGARVRVRADVSDELLRWLYRSDPSIELEVEIGSDERAAREARSLLDRLGGKARAPSP